MENWELKAIIKNREIKPSDLFDEYELLHDPKVKKAVKDEAEKEIHFRDMMAEEELNEEMNKEIEDEESDVSHIPGCGSSDDSEKEGDASHIPD